MAGTVESAIYKVGYDTGDSVQKLDAARIAAEKLANTTETVSVTEEKVAKATRTTADAMDRLLGRLDPVIRAEQRLQQVKEQVNRIQEQGLDPLNRGSQAILLAQQRVDKLTAANDNARTGLGLLGEGIGSVTRLLGPFGAALSVGAVLGWGSSIVKTAADLDEQAEQIGVSTAALQAYRAELREDGIAHNQVDQILQRLTRNIGEAQAATGSQREAFQQLGFTAKDLAGGTESVLPRVAAALLKIEDASTRAKLEADLFGKTGQRLESGLRDLAVPTGDLINKQIQLGHVLAEDVTLGADKASDGIASAWDRIENRVAPKVTVFAGVLADLLDKLSRLGQADANLGGGTSASVGLGYFGGRLPRVPNAGAGGPANDNASTANFDAYLAKAKTAAELAGLSATRRAQEQAAIEAANAKLKDNNAWVDATSHTLLKSVDTYAQAKQVLTDIQLKEVEHLATVKEAAKHTEKIKQNQIDISAVNDRIEKSAQQTVDVELKAEKYRQDYLRHQQQVVEETDSYITDLQREVDLTGMSADERERAAAELRGMQISEGKLTDAQKDQIDNLVKARQATERWRSVVDGLSSGFQSAFEDIFENGISRIGSLWDAIKRQFIQLLAWMASQALLQPIIVPIATGMMSSLGLGGGGGLSGILGGGGGPLWGSTPDGLGNFLGGIGSSLSSAAAGIGSFLGLGGGAAASAVPLTFTGASGATLSAGSISSAMPALGAGASLGSILGGAGLGALASSLIFGNKNSAGIGGMGGAAAGALIGSIVPGIGTIIGGLAGGLLGGGLGSMTGTSNQGAIANFTNGGAGSYLFKQGGGNNGQLSTQAANSVSQAISTLQAAGVNVGLGNITGLSIGSDKSYVYDSLGGKQKLAGGDVQSVVDAILTRILPSATATTSQAQAVLDRYNANGGVNKDNLQQLIQDLGAAQQFVDAINSLQVGPDSLSDGAKAIKAINDQIDPLIKQAQALGQSTDNLEAIRQSAIAATRQAAEDSVSDALQQLTDPMGYQFDQLLKSEQARLQNLKDLGADLSDVYKLNALEQQSYIDQITANNQASEAAAAQRVADAHASLADAYDQEAQKLQDTISKYRDVAGGLRDYLTQIGGGSSDPMSRYAALKGQFSRTSALALAGDLTAMSSLQQISQDFLTASKAASTSLAQYRQDRALVTGSIAGAADLADAQATDAANQLNALNEQVQGLITLNGTVVTVREAIDALQQATAAQNKQIADNTAQTAKILRQVTRDGSSLLITDAG